MPRPLSVSLVLLWIGFFATSAYGHVALKLAVDARRLATPLGGRSLWGAAISPLGVSAYVAWALSAVLWMALLSRHSLFAANGISALRYALVAACAPIFLRESLDRLQIVGGVLIAIGVWLVVR
jgi:drug/metabolite transporter (DMT)-like permease